MEQIVNDVSFKNENGHFVVFLKNQKPMYFGGGCNHVELLGNGRIFVFSQAYPNRDVITLAIITIDEIRLIIHRPNTMELINSYDD